MIILEGSDLSGKTTLATLLTQQFVSKLDHLGLPPLGQRHKDIVCSALINNPQNTVYDRMMVGSWVFRSVKPDERNVNGVTTDELGAWQKLVRELPNTLVVRCWASKPKLLARFKLRGDEYINQDELLKSAELYDTAFNLWGYFNPGDFLTYNSGEMSPQDFVSLHRSAIANALSDDNYLSPADVDKVREAMAP